MACETGAARLRPLSRPPTIRMAHGFRGGGPPGLAPLARRPIARRPRRSRGRAPPAVARLGARPAAIAMMVGLALHGSALRRCVGFGASPPARLLRSPSVRSNRRSLGPPRLPPAPGAARPSSAASCRSTGGARSRPSPSRARFTKSGRIGRSALSRSCSGNSRRSPKARTPPLRDARLSATSTCPAAGDRRSTAIVRPLRSWVALRSTRLRGPAASAAISARSAETCLRRRSGVDGAGARRGAAAGRARAPPPGRA